MDRKNRTNRMKDRKAKEAARLKRVAERRRRHEERWEAHLARASAAKRAKAALMALVLAVSQLMGVLSPMAASRAYAASGVTFPNGGSATVQDDGSITGTCELWGSYYDQEEPIGRHGNVTMPDGAVIKAGCYEVYIGDPEHMKYTVPANGSYPFTATPNGDGGYFVLIHSQNGGAVEGSPVTGYTQRSYATEPWRPDLTVDVTFTKLSADADFVRGNPEYSVAGAEYELTHTASGEKTRVVLDANGHADLKLKRNAHYTYRETKAPKGYKLDTQTHEFWTGNSTSEERHHDDPGFLRLQVQKKDSATNGAAQAGATLEGAEFRLTDTNGNSHTGRTDKNGILWFDYIPLGTSTVVETKAPVGYKLDPTPKTYTIHANQITNAGTFELTPADDYKENVKAFNIKLVKYLDTGNEGSGLQQPGKGIRFEVVSNTTKQVVATMTTDAEGRAELTGGWYGAGTRNDGIKGCLPYDAAGYTVREVASTVPDGFAKAPDWQITPEQMVDGATLSYIVDNDRVESHLQIVKTDAVSGQNVPLAGFKFQVVGPDGNVVKNELWYPNYTVLDTFTTDESGMVTMPEGLQPGTYTIREVASAAPYLVGPDVRFTIASSASVPPVTVVRFADTQATGEATIVKSDSETGAKLAGAVYNVVAQEDVVSPDGRVQAVAGQVMGTATTGDDGTAKVSGLPLGPGTARYAFVETRAPSGYVLDVTPVGFELSWKDGSTPVVTARAEATNAPNELVLAKVDASSGKTLPGAVIGVWEKGGEAEGTEGKTTVRVVAQGGAGKVTFEGDDAGPRVSVTGLPGSDYALSLENADGERIALGEKASPVPAGEYTPVLTKGGEDVAAAGTERMDLEDGRSYAFDVTELAGILFVGCDESDFDNLVEAAPVDGAEGTFEAALDNGSYFIDVDGKRLDLVGPAADRLVVADGRDVTVFAGEGDVPEGCYVEALIDSNTEMHVVTTGDDGTASIKRLGENDRAVTYNVAELAAPAGYVVNHEVTPVTVAETGLVEGEASYAFKLANEPTKVDVSKVEVTGGPEVPGAKLAVIDADGNVVDEWVSTDEPHRIEALSPGTYTLTEVMTPRTYDEATEVVFEVLESGLVNKVEMVDEPIRISAELDKRQQIADPVADDVVEDGDGANRAPVTESKEGRFEYTVDHRSTSSTWTDEYTVEDPLEAVAAGLAELDALHTGVAGPDFDGKLNVWYKTNLTPDDHVDASGANQTLSDGHENPWLAADENAERLGDDGRRLDYTGWRLWKADVPACVDTELSVADLGLAEDERVTAVRLEYGRVNPGFTSRPDDASWGRDDLFDEHDDIAAVEPGDAFECPLPGHDGHGEDGEARFAPIRLSMHVTGDYVPGTDLENSANVFAARNGGDDAVLEDGNDDRVVQTPKTDDIEISGKLDKRQEIADPVADGVVENGDGKNTAAVTVSPEGRYDYTLDFENTSSTWVDEFTVTDELDCVGAGLARMTGLTTPQAWQDYDGKLNVWYTTNGTDRDFRDPSGADATVSDGHVNEGAERQLSYDGWHLWKADVSATAADELSVSDLALPEGEYVTAVRFEYGRVERGFTTRTDLWDRNNLKNGHDDIADATANSTTFTDADGNEVAYAPAILHMEVTDAYVPGTDLDNSAKLYLARFAYGELMESEDRDAVTQTPKDVPAPDASETPGTPGTPGSGSDMSQTGVPAIGLALAAAAGIAGIAYAKRRLDAPGEADGSGAEDRDGDKDGKE